MLLAGTYNVNWREQSTNSTYSYPIVNVTGAPAGSMRSSLPPPPDNINEDDYRKQLRKMQRSLSPGSLQQLQSMPPEPMVGSLCKDVDIPMLNYRLVACTKPRVELA